MDWFVLLHPCLHSHYCVERTVKGKAQRRTGSPVDCSIVSFFVCLEVPWLFCSCFFACSFAILIIHLMFFIFFFIGTVRKCLWPSHFVSFSTLATKPLYIFHHSSLFFFFICFLRQQRAEDSFKCVFIMAVFCNASLVGQKKQQGIFFSFFYSRITRDWS